MEHDTFGDDASCIIVDERGELVLSHIYDGFDETAVNLLRQEVMPVEDVYKRQLYIPTEALH